MVDDKEGRNKKAYYWPMVDKTELYAIMVEIYDKCTSKEYLLHCQHIFDTQRNEGINNKIAAYAGKGKHYAGTSSIINRVLIADGVHLVRYHHFWIFCFNLFEVAILY